MSDAAPPPTDTQPDGLAPDDMPVVPEGVEGGGQPGEGAQGEQTSYSVQVTLNNGEEEIAADAWEFEAPDDETAMIVAAETLATEFGGALADATQEGVPQQEGQPQQPLPEGIPGEGAVPGQGQGLPGAPPVTG